MNVFGVIVWEHLTSFCSALHGLLCFRWCWCSCKWSSEWWSWSHPITTSSSYIPHLNTHHYHHPNGNSITYYSKSHTNQTREDVTQWELQMRHVHHVHGLHFLCFTLVSLNSPTLSLFTSSLFWSISISFSVLISILNSFSLFLSFSLFVNNQLPHCLFLLT